MYNIAKLLWYYKVVYKYKNNQLTNKVLNVED
jgi:hypothetical protein